LDHSTESGGDPCGRMKRWLDSHSPNSARWRALCLAYFDSC
jgi:hypothetical protein